ncbi:MAG: serine protease [Candidatus Acidiferrales bacterium]
MLRIVALVVGLLVLPGGNHRPEHKMTLPEAIEFMRPSVVQVSLRVDPAPTGRPFEVPARPVVVPLGSGFLVSVDGYAVTARHVVEAFHAVQTNGRKTLVVGLALPNLENYKSGGATISIRGSFRYVNCEVVDEDVRHDLALLQLDPNPFTHKASLIETPKETIDALERVAPLASSRPVDGQAIAVSGYPFNETVLITTSGSLASSWAYDSALGQIPGAPSGSLAPDVADSYLADVHVNPGNSGGPVYSVENGMVIGVCVAYDMAPVVYGDGNHEPASVGNRPIFSNSGLAVVVPVPYVVDLLKKQRQMRERGVPSVTGMRDLHHAADARFDSWCGHHRY